MSGIEKFQKPSEKEFDQMNPFLNNNIDPLSEEVIDYYLNLTDIPRDYVVKALTRVVYFRKARARHFDRIETDEEYAGNMQTLKESLPVGTNLIATLKPLPAL